MTPEMKGFLLLTVLKLLFIFTVVMVGVALLTLMERKVSAWMQNRLGPNRVGYGGLLQPAADGLKNILKEETFPAEANPVLFTIAPALAFIPALMLSAVIPFAAPLPINSDDFGRDLGHWFAWIPGIGAWLDQQVAAAFHFVFGVMAHHGPMPMVVADVPVGFLFFLVSGFAEPNRLPFDLPEAESELIAGYHTEYSAMKFSFFFIAEYANVVTISAMIATIFFGGWDIPFVAIGTAKPWAVITLEPGLLATLLSGIVFFAKLMFWIFFVMWIRWTLPRFRYDQLMALGWKFFMPVTLGYIMLVCVVLYAAERAGVRGTLQTHLVLTGLSVVLAILLFLVLDRGLILGGSAVRRARAAAMRQAQRLAASS